MSLDIDLMVKKGVSVFEMNVTHNLTKMASRAGIYKIMWRPGELGLTKAGELIHPLEAGLAELKKRQDFFETLNPPNGWGSYGTLVRAVEVYLKACRENPDARLVISI